MSTDNYRKHTSKNPLQRFLIDRFYRVLLEELRELRPASILDAGCGEGFTLERLRAAGIGDVLSGIDASPAAIALARTRHPSFPLRVGSIYELPYGDETFDTVLCLEVLEHLDDPARALAELRRVAKRYCIISVPHEPFFRLANVARGKNLSRFGNDIEHIQQWSARGIARLVGTAFAVRAVRNPFPWTIVIAEKV